MKALAVILLGVLVLGGSTRQLLAEQASFFSIATLWLVGIVPGIVFGFVCLRKQRAVAAQALRRR